MMKIYCAIIMFVFVSATTFAQSDFSVLSNSCENDLKEKFPSLHYSYGASKQLHDYSNNWDFDADGIKDSLFFIGNGGAHIYYHLRIVSSSDNKATEFLFLAFDFPCLGNNGSEKPKFIPSPDSPQFIVADFDADGTDEIFLNLEIKYAPIPKEWKEKGLTSRYILVKYVRGEITVKNFIN